MTLPGIIWLAGFFLSVFNKHSGYWSLFSTLCEQMQCAAVMIDLKIKMMINELSKCFNNHNDVHSDESNRYDMTYHYFQTTYIFPYHYL